VNEFRGALEDAERTKYPRREAEAQISSLNERLTKLERARTGDAGQQLGLKSGYLWAIGVVVLISTIFGVVGVVMVFISTRGL